ncbi:hypothetical protein [Thermosulfurimonas sp. F29]|uniref:hypothetical protein n=1 Tax=Thermosulfurimonas sp. F29 TaxID=2867247 RepID=UPI001C829FB5|nr:hypothetical protein [Thermosulfurimonas sp. F29]MBX6423350.1 hypothetical protein [Thermosulfurimonas sp. F29]
MGEIVTSKPFKVKADEVNVLARLVRAISQQEGVRNVFVHLEDVSRNGNRNPVITVRLVSFYPESDHLRQATERLIKKIVHRFVETRKPRLRRTVELGR